MAIAALATLATPAAAGESGENAGPRPGRLPYTFNNGSRPGLELVRLERISEDKIFPWRRHLPGGRVDHLAFDKDGSIRIGATEDAQHETLTCFEPALPAYRPEQLRNKPEMVRGRAVVYQRGTKTIKQKGDFAYELRRFADETLEAGKTRIRCGVYRQSLSIELGVANVSSVTTDWFGPEGLLVAERATETVRALLPLWTTEHQLTLAAVPTNVTVMASVK